MNPALFGFRLGWATVGRLPEPAVVVAAERIADRAAATGGPRVEQYRRTLARIRPDLGDVELDHLVRAGLRSYARYWVDLFRLPRVSPVRVDATVRVRGDDGVRELLASGRGVLVVLAHQGNWDQAGAWSARHLAPVLTVAERLSPPELFTEFVDQRARLGIRALPLGEAGTTRALLEGLRSGALVALLGDRDLSGDGIEVDFGGSPATVPAGPAWLALASGAALVVATMSSVPLPRNDPAHRLGARYRLDLEFSAPLPLPPAGPRRERVAALAQTVADALVAGIRAAPADWHVLQPFFTADRATGPEGPEGPEGPA